MGKTVIDASKGKLGINLGELFAYKDLFLTLAFRDIKVRYAHTMLGLAWTVLQPVATLLIFILIFSKAIHVDTGTVPYALHALTGLCAWTYFSSVLTQAGGSIVGQQNMIQKIYFPRLIIPLSKSLAALLDFCITLGLLFALMLYYGFIPPLQIIFLPLFIALNIIASLAIGIWLSALTVRFRDFQYITPFMVQFGLYATPVAYPSSLIPAKYQLLYSLNPMVGVIEGFRWCLLGESSPSAYTWLSMGLLSLLFVSGLLYFRKVESTMADII